MQTCFWKLTLRLVSELSFEKKKTKIRNWETNKETLRNCGITAEKGGKMIKTEEKCSSIFVKNHLNNKKILKVNSSSKAKIQKDYCNT